MRRRAELPAHQVDGNEVPIWAIGAGLLSRVEANLRLAENCSLQERHQVKGGQDANAA
jgi:hypothetical protein